MFAAPSCVDQSFMHYRFSRDGSIFEKRFPHPPSEATEALFLSLSSFPILVFKAQPEQTIINSSYFI